MDIQNHVCLSYLVISAVVTVRAECMTTDRRIVGDYWPYKQPIDPGALLPVSFVGSTPRGALTHG